MKMIHRDIHVVKKHAHWEKRPEKNWENFRYNQPYAKGLKKIGHDIGSQILKDTEIDPEITTDEWISFYATVVNRVAYASLEAPKADGGDVNFHIDYCPHQDMYQAMDCRVQRYFVQDQARWARYTDGFPAQK